MLQYKLELIKNVLLTLTFYIPSHLQCLKHKRAVHNLRHKAETKEW